MLPKDLPTLIGAIAGFIMSILVEIPGIKAKFDSLSTPMKRLVMSALLVVGAGIAYGATCLGWLGMLFPNIPLTCDEGGLAVLISALFAALTANQATYSLFFKKPSTKKAVKSYQGE
jgi:hypothetical protein